MRVYGLRIQCDTRPVSVNSCKTAAYGRDAAARRDRSVWALRHLSYAVVAQSLYHKTSNHVVSHKADAVVLSTEVDGCGEEKEEQQAMR